MAAVKVNTYFIGVIKLKYIDYFSTPDGDKKNYVWTVFFIIFTTQNFIFYKEFRNTFSYIFWGNDRKCVIIKIIFFVEAITTLIC